MTIAKRRVLLYGLIVVFFAAVPVLIAFSVGYTFNLGTRTVEKTGGIFVKSRTPRISISLDGSHLDNTSLISGGALLTQVTPGIRLIRLDKIGYVAWFKAIEVSPSLVIELRNIVLIPRPLIVATSTPGEALRVSQAFAAETMPAATGNYRLDRSGNLIGAINASSTRKLASNVNSFGMVDTILFFIDKNGFLAKIDPATRETQTIGHPGFFLNSTPVKFIAAPSGDLVLIDPSGGLYLLDSTGALIPTAGGVRKIYFDSGGGKALLLRDDGIDVLWLRDNPYQPFQKRGTKEVVLNNINNRIEDARWLYKDDAHIVIRTENGMFITEIDGRGGRNTYQLVSGAVDFIFTMEDSPEKIFYRKRGVTYAILL